MPTQPTFPGQMEGEKVIVYERKHWLVLLESLWLPLLLVLICGLIACFITVLSRGKAQASPVILTFLWLVMVGPGLCWCSWEVWDWRNDLYIVTNERVIHIERGPLVREMRDEASLEVIQDVHIVIKGKLRNVLDVGDIDIETAGVTMRGVHFRGIGHPRQVQARIMALIERLRMGAEVEEAALEDLRQRMGMLPRREVAPSVPPPPQAELPRWLRKLRELFLVTPYFGENQVIWHKHPYVLFTKIWWVVLLSLLLLGLMLMTWRLSRLWLMAVLVLAFLAMAAKIAWEVVDWRNDIYAITDDRVIDIEKVPFKAESRLEARLDRIQNVRYLKPSVLARILNFGNVRLETAGREPFTFEYVRNPEAVQQEISRRLERYRRRMWQREKEAREEEILRILARYHRNVIERGGGSPESESL